MFRKATAVLTALLVTLSFTSCQKEKKSKKDNSSLTISEQTNENDPIDETTALTEEATQEPTTVHVSPVEKISATLGTQVTPNALISREDGENTYKLSLSDLIESGDKIESFTFVIYSGDSSNIGQFTGGFGVSVNSDCAAATDKGWFQSEDITASTQGTYGEIVWKVPDSIKDYITADGELLFGYWWGDTQSIRLDTVVCSFTRNREIPVDGTAEKEINASVQYESKDNIVGFKVNDVIPNGCIPQAVTYNISSGGAFRKFTGAFCASSDNGRYQSKDIAVFTDNSSLSLTWILPEQAKNDLVNGGEISLGYWWSEQPSVTLNSVSVKYSVNTVSSIPEPTKNETSKEENLSYSAKSPDGSFRTSSEIVDSIKVGWNLGNSLEPFNYASITSDAELAWGNPKTTKEMIKSAKDKGFNAIRIPVTWSDHLNGNIIDSEWLDRVQQVVDYAYDLDMFVIVNMHHDDYSWFVPDKNKYAENSKKLCAIWEQISERFADYDDTLLFEGMNEPRTVGSAAEWSGGTAEEREVVNKYEQDFINTVRSSGGNNAKRSLIITSYAASAEDAAINDIAIPNDKNIIISVHYYAPWNFSDGKTTSFTYADKTELSNKFKQLKSKFVDKGIPVIIGEFGCVNKADDSVREEYFSYYISAAKSCGIKCFVWDNGSLTGDSAFGILTRSTLSWNSKIIDGIMNGAE